MTVAFESGYTLPSGDLPLNHARVLHDGNRFKVKTVTASSELALYPGSAANSGDTVDRWRPFENEVLDPSDFSTANWTLLNLTVGSDGQTLTDDATSGQHRAVQSFTFEANTYVTAVEVERQTAVGGFLLATDGVTSFSCYFDLTTQSVVLATNCTGQVVNLGSGKLLLSISYTAQAGTGSLQFRTTQTTASSGTPTSSYSGDGDTVKVNSFITHKSEATLTYDLFTAQEGDTFAIAAHNLWSSGATLKPQYLGDDVTNLLTYSEQFDNVAWGKGGTSTIASGEFGQIFRCGATATSQLTSTTYAVGAGESFTESIFAQSEVSDFVVITLADLTSGAFQRVWFDLLTGSVGSSASSGSTVTSPVASISGPDANGRYRCALSATFTNATTTRFALNISNSDNTFDGDASSGVYIFGAQLQTGTEATSYIKTEATAVTSGWRDFDTFIEPIDNSPVVFIYEPITSAGWRIQASGGALPEIGVFRVGKSLQMERPFYGGFTIPRMARNAVVRGNISGSGELLGRSLERTTLNTSYQWQHLSYAWVRANLDGPNGLIQSAETEPLFLAWRPSETQDVDYVMRASTEPPNAMGLRDLWTFGMSGEAYSYE